MLYSHQKLHKSDVTFKETPHPSSAYIGSFVIVDSVSKEEHGKDELFLWRTYGKHDLEEAAGACLIFKHEETALCRGHSVKDRCYASIGEHGDHILATTCDATTTQTSPLSDRLSERLQKRR